MKVINDFNKKEMFKHKKCCPPSFVVQNKLMLYQRQAIDTQSLYLNWQWLEKPKQTK